MESNKILNSNIALKYGPKLYEKIVIDYKIESFNLINRYSAHFRFSIQRNYSQKYRKQFSLDRKKI